jgi:uncharacterized membrane protein
MRAFGSFMRKAAFLLSAAPLLAVPAGAQQAEVRAVLFYSPSCPHCHIVMEQHLPPLMERFGEQLQVITINTATPDGWRLYQDVVGVYAVTRDRLGVPALAVGGRVLVGAEEIPQQLPGIIADGLAAGGIDWPEVRSIRDALAHAGMLRPLATHPGSAVESQSAPGQQPLVDLTDSVAPATMLQRFMRDPAGNGVAVLILGGLLLVLAWSLLTVRRGTVVHGSMPTWFIPTLVLVGIGVASYLSFIEVTGSVAVCGPVGDCNTVQQSPYATLFGVLPVGVLGLLGYAGMGGLWLLSRANAPARRRTGHIALWLTAVGGTVFSAYLTFLEPFVIGASCAWCLTSAAVTAVILMAATPAASRSLALSLARSLARPPRG